MKAAVTIAASLALHCAVVFGAMSVRAPERTRVPTTVEIEMVSKKPLDVEPTPEPSASPAPEPSPNAARVPINNERMPPSSPPPLRPEDEDLKPSTVAADPNARPEVGKTATAKVDLSLRALGPAEGVILPAGSGAAPTSTARKEYKPRLSAGDPILGKVTEEKEERFPLKALGGGHYAYSGQGFNAHILPSGEVNFDDKTFSNFNGTSVNFDITDMIMRSKKQDPYRYQKQKFMEETLEMRTKMQNKVRHEAVRGSLAALSDYLDQVWGMKRSAKERRRVILQLWDETSGGEDRELEKAGEEARIVILAFVKKRIPSGSDFAFTQEELDAHNRGNKPRFDPYAQN